MDLFFYLLVFLASLLVDLVPLIGPPAWTIMVFFQIKFDLDIWPVLVIGVIGSALGRYFYSQYIPYFSNRLIKPSKNTDLQFVGQKLSHKNWKVYGFVLLYTLMPLPSTPLFTAAGIARVRTIMIIPSFIAGKFISDAVPSITIPIKARSNRSANSLKPIFDLKKSRYTVTWKGSLEKINWTLFIPNWYHAQMIQSHGKMNFGNNPGCHFFNQPAMNLLINKIGFWSGLIAFAATLVYCVAQLLQLYGILTFPWDEKLIYGSSLCIFLPFLLEIIALHYVTGDNRKFWTHIAVVFATIYAIYVTANYVVQLATVIPTAQKGLINEVKILQQTPHSMFWNFDALGYIFMGLATLAAIPALDKYGFQKWVRLSFIANASVTPLITIVYFSNDYSYDLLMLGLPWIVTAPASMLMLALMFRKKGNTEKVRFENNEPTELKTRPSRGLSRIPDSNW